MNDTSKYWSGAFGGLRVPFDHKLIILGILAILLFTGGSVVINIFAEEDYLLTRYFYSMASLLGEKAEKNFHPRLCCTSGKQGPRGELQGSPGE